MNYCEKYEQCESGNKSVRLCMHCKEFNKRHIKFIKIDNWNRPIFKVLEKEYYISDLENLFPMDTSESKIKEFYKGKKLCDVLTYHGSKADCEPMGNNLKDFNFVFV